ncbi:MAG: hypothetical protein JKY53_01740 [Flavobacteriales bacterium]|nr:hypothetical protein [Flavobacteriales bacterium]
MKQLTALILLLTSIIPVIAQNDSDTINVDQPRYDISLGVMVHLLGDRYEIGPTDTYTLFLLTEQHGLQRNALAYLDVTSPILEIRRTNGRGISQAIQGGYWVGKEREDNGERYDDIQLNHSYLLLQQCWPILTIAKPHNGTGLMAYAGASLLSQYKSMSFEYHYYSHDWTSVDWQHTSKSYSMLLAVPIGIKICKNRMFFDVAINVNIIGQAWGKLRTNWYYQESGSVSVQTNEQTYSRRLSYRYGSYFFGYNALIKIGYRI